MSIYHFKFFKNLLSADGHPFNVLQGTIDVRRSRSPERAMRAAKRRFARARNVSDWTLHADAIEPEVENDKTDDRLRAKLGSAG
jgi:hypothetical protein